MRYLRQDDFDVYGGQLIDLTARAAREAMEPELQNLHARQAELAQREQRLQNKLVLDALDKAMPDWRITNNDPRFLEFLSAQEELSGRQAHALLLEAFAAGQVSQILVFFNDFLRASGQAPAPQAPAPQQQSPSVQQRPAAMTIGAALEKFYRDVAAGRWNGRDAEKAQEERRLHNIAHNRR